jgi:deoxyribose-phosphate aldolase
MSHSKEQIAAALDLAVLKPTATANDVARACALANAHKIKSVCVSPVYVSLAANLFRNVSCVIGFPNGNTTPEAKLYEAATAIQDGAQELDMVLNYGRFLDGDSRPLFNELGLIVAGAHRDRILVKAILETSFYSRTQISEVCHICIDFGVDFVKTSTGFAGDATPEAVETMVKTVNGQCGVKASGGIKTYEDAARYLDLGCTRLGSSRFLELLPCT